VFVNNCGIKYHNYSQTLKKFRVNLDLIENVTIMVTLDGSRYQIIALIKIVTPLYKTYE